MPVSLPLRLGSLFSGYGGLDLGIEAVMDVETVWFSEVNQRIANVFATHWPGVPNLGDITSIDWARVGPVDVLCGGFPCQDLSTAGLGKGLAGTRSGLWHHMCQAIGVLRPQLVVFENVRGLLSTAAGDTDDDPGCEVESDAWGVANVSGRSVRAMGRVLGDLASLGYDAVWCGLPASSVGAPHHRFRVFAVAWPAAADPTSLPPRQSQRELGGSSCPPRFGHTDSSSPSPDEPTEPQSRLWGEYAAAIKHWERVTGRVAPVPVIVDGAARSGASPKFVEWMMGLAEGWVTSPDHDLSIAQQLQALGNGVVPQQAYAAITTLLNTIGDASS